jgi:hypothetical protein
LPVRIPPANFAGKIALAAILQGESLFNPQLHYLVRMFFIFLPHYTTKAADAILLFRVSFSLATFMHRETMLQQSPKMIRFALIAARLKHHDCSIIASLHAANSAFGSCC